jgi:hypothetical protein
LPLSQFQRLDADRVTPSPKLRAALNPGVIKKRFSLKLSTDLAMIDRHVSNETAPTVKEKDKKDSAPSDPVPTMKEIVKEDSSDPEKSESVDTFDIDAIGEFNVIEDAGLENTPDDETCKNDGKRTEKDDGKCTEKDDGKCTEKDDGKCTEKDDGKCTEKDDGKYTEKDDGKYTEKDDGKYEM